MRERLHDDKPSEPSARRFNRHDPTERAPADDSGAGSTRHPRLPRPRVLIVATRFPPIASVGATRIRKLAQYLSGFGWQPIILTGPRPPRDVATQAAAAAVDEDGLADLPANLPIHRLPGRVDDWPDALCDVLDRASRAGAGCRRSFLSLGLCASTWPLADALRWRLKRLYERFAFPDRFIWRLPAILLAARRLHRRHRFDAIFTSGMPFSDHVAGLALQSALRRPWIADFRDPWVEYVHWPQWRSPREEKLARALEAAVVRRAARVVSVNDHMTRRFIARYPRLHPEKFVTISNGYDPADFNGCSQREPRRRFRVVYAGSLYGARGPQHVIAAFRRFIERVPGSSDRATFDFYGRPGPHLEALLRAADVGRIRYGGFIPHRAALQETADADLNVVLLPNVAGGRNDTTAKIYECLGSGRPLLAAVPLDGAAAAALRGFDGVSLVDPDDIDAIASAITHWYVRWLADDLHVRRPVESLAPLTRRYQAGRLAALLWAIRRRRHCDAGPSLAEPPPIYWNDSVGAGPGTLRIAEDLTSEAADFDLKRHLATELSSHIALGANT